MRSIRQQLLLGLLSGTLACTLFAGIATYVKVREEANELFDTQLRQVAIALPASLAPQQPVPGLENPEDDMVVQSWDAGGNLLYRSQAAPALPRILARGFKTVEALDDRWRVFGDLRHGRYVQVAQPVDVRDELAAKLALRAIVPFLILLPVLGLLIGLVVKKSLQPLHDIADGLRQRSPGALQPLDTASMPPELMPILEALNDLLQRLAQSITAQRAFVADAAHELRSPLTALKLQLQLVERAVNDAHHAAAFGKLHDRVDRSAHLVRQLLTLARQEAHEVERDMMPVNLQRIAEQVIADKSTLADGKQIDLGLAAGGDDPMVCGHADSLQIMLNNLVDNALRYTPCGGQVDVRILAGDRDVTVQVIDSGPGIAAADRERVFDRFYRGDEAGATGSGLGLAIVKSIADQHEARIALSQDGKSGLTVTIVFRRWRPDRA